MTLSAASQSSIPGLTATEVTFGFIIPQRGAMFGLGSTRELIELGVQADRSGSFDAVWVGDSLTSKFRPESLTCLGALASTTSHVRLAVGCMGSFPLRDPALFALQWATLDHLSAGRMLLSVCTGIQGHGGSVLEGQNFGGLRDRDRAECMAENIEICRRLWAGEEFDFDGKYHSYSQIQIEPAPVQQPCPIWITANPRPGKFYESVLKRVGTIADGWMTTYPGAAEFKVMAGIVKEAAEARGVSGEEFPTAVYHNINVAGSRREAMDETKRFTDLYYGLGILDPWIENMTVGGRPEDCVEQLVDLAVAGVRHIALRLTSFDQVGQLHRVLEEVLPVAAEVIKENDLTRAKRD